MQKLFKLRKKTIRLRLTAWYVLLLGCTLGLFCTYLYFQLENSLLGQLDTALKLTASETLNQLVEQESYPALKDTTKSQAITNQLSSAGLAVRLIAPDGKVWDGFGNYQEIPSTIPQKTGYLSLKKHNQIWRIYSQLLPQSSTQCWLQVAQPLKPVSEASEHLLKVMFLSVPLVLFVAFLGGLFLAERALSPIDKITRTAQRIGISDFTERIGYQGAPDEVGRLATTLDRMLDRLQAAFEHERRFTADASHELRTPLTVIKGRIGVTLSRDRNPREYQDTLRDLEVQVDRLIRLANGLLFLTRLEQKEIAYQADFTRVDLSNLLEVLIEQVESLATDKNISISARVGSSIYVDGNSDHLISLFLNLLDNAIKYTPKGGQITLEGWQEDRQINITINNTGRGIASEHLPHLFERFYREESARSRNTGGAGLGLAIAYEIARLHGGKIIVSSRVNHLTTFTVLLPVSSA